MTSRFDEVAPSYQEAVEGSISFVGGELEYFTRRKADLLIELCGTHLGWPADLALADVGCGVGFTDSMIVDRVGSVTGFDASAESLAVAAETNPEASYLHVPDLALPAESETFDVAFAINVIHHVDPHQRLAFMSELRRIVRPGGIVIIFEHNPFNPLTRLSVMRCEFDEGVELVSRRGLRRLASDSGLTALAGHYVIFSTSNSRMLLDVERRLGWLPLGAQHVLVARV